MDQDFLSQSGAVNDQRLPRAHGTYAMDVVHGNKEEGEEEEEEVEEEEEEEEEDEEEVVDGEEQEKNLHISNNLQGGDNYQGHPHGKSDVSEVEGALNETRLSDVRE